jgi:hypothetical protein
MHLLFLVVRTIGSILLFDLRFNECALMVVVQFGTIRHTDIISSSTRDIMFSYVQIFFGKISRSHLPFKNVLLE